MESKEMYPPGTVASVNGYHSPTGELLAASPNTQADVDAWNGVTKAPPVTAKSETSPVAPIAAPAPKAKKKKKAWYKK
jgi:hypothetical protein